MKITDERFKEDQCHFSDIKVGTAFKYGNDTYIKVELMIKTTNIYNEENKYVNCIDLVDGIGHCLLDNSTVLPLKNTWVVIK